MFWGAPKVNFHHRLPEWLAPFVPSDEALEYVELAGGGQIDRATYHVVDQAVPREKLGKHVLTLELDGISSFRIPANDGVAHGDGVRNSDVAYGTPQCSGGRREAKRRRLSAESDNEAGETNLQPGLEQQMLDEVDVSCVLFDTDVPLMEKVQLLPRSPLARTNALEWEPKASSASGRSGSWRPLGCST